jgi:hypothetical protein
MAYPNDTKNDRGSLFPLPLRYTRGGTQFAVTVNEDQTLRGVRYFDPPADSELRKIGPINDRFEPDPEGFEEVHVVGLFTIFSRDLPPNTNTNFAAIASPPDMTPTTPTGSGPVATESFRVVGATGRTLIRRAQDI